MIKKVFLKNKMKNEYLFILFTSIYANESDFKFKKKLLKLT